MSVELLQILSLVSYIAAGIMLFVSIALFFILDIKKVIGDISGATARKAINNIREQNEKTGNKAYKSSPVNSARGRLTDKMTASGNLQTQTPPMGGSPGTEKFNTAELISLPDTAYENPAGATTVLSDAFGETSVFSAESGDTTILSKSDLTYDDSMELFKRDNEALVSFTNTTVKFTKDIEMSFTDTTEIIE